MTTDANDDNHHLLYSTQELAEIIGSTPSTLARWRTKHIGPPWIRLHGRIRYAQQDVNLWLNGRKEDGAS